MSFAGPRRVISYSIQSGQQYNKADDIEDIRQTFRQNAHLLKEI